MGRPRDAGRLADREARAEQRGREDNADHGMCYVHGSEALAALLRKAAADALDEAHLARQAAWSRETFGPGDRVYGVTDHIARELAEVREAHEAGEDTLPEWVDVVILALDGCWRSGATPERIIAAIKAKQAKNEAREWPDWRTAPADRAIEHVDRARRIREGDA